MGETRSRHGRDKKEQDKEGLTEAENMVIEGLCMSGVRVCVKLGVAR